MFCLCKIPAAVVLRKNGENQTNICCGKEINFAYNGTTILIRVSGYGYKKRYVFWKGGEIFGAANTGVNEYFAKLFLPLPVVSGQAQQSVAIAR